MHWLGEVGRHTLMATSVPKIIEISMPVRVAR